MKYFPEATIFETKDGIQWKAYASGHPDGRVIARPKYIPRDKVRGGGMASRFLFGRNLVRFNPFAPQKYLHPFIKSLKKYYPRYFYRSPLHGRWFFAVPEKYISKVYDARAGAAALFGLTPKNLDPYLSLVRKLLVFLAKSGVKKSDFGLTNSTLLGNYTFGKSDIDVVIFGKKNGWRVLKFLARAGHKLLRWKSGKEWRKYFRTHGASPAFTEGDFVRHALRKKNEGVFGGHVFTVFTVEEPGEVWPRWGDERYLRLGNAEVIAKIANDRGSLCRPALYVVSGAEIKKFGGKRLPHLPLSRIITYALPYFLQARKGEWVAAAGELEKVVPRRGKPFLRLVVEYPKIISKQGASKGYIKIIKK